MASKHRDALLTQADFQRIAGVSARTAGRWSRDGVRPELAALLRLVKVGDLGALHAAWAGWVIRADRLYDCASSAYRGWTPAHVRALDWVHDLRREQDRQLAHLRAQLQDRRRSEAGLARGVCRRSLTDRRGHRAHTRSTAAQEFPR